MVDEWIALQGGWHSVAWQPEIVARRIISWLCQSPLILHDADLRFYRRFLRSLTRQVRYLRGTAGDAQHRGEARPTDGVGALGNRVLHLRGEVRRARRGRYLARLDR